MAATIRATSADDWDAVIPLFDALDEFHRRELPWLFQEPGAAFRDRQFLEAIASNDRAQIFVAADQDVVVGFVHVRLFDTPDTPAFIEQLRAAVDDLFVDPTCRRSGIARKLLKTAEDWARSKGAVGIDLNVYAFNTTGQRVFAAAGFEILSKRMTKHLP